MVSTLRCAVDRQVPAPLKSDRNDPDAKRSCVSTTCGMCHHGWPVCAGDVRTPRSLRNYDGCHTPPRVCASPDPRGTTISAKPLYLHVLQAQANGSLARVDAPASAVLLRLQLLSVRGVLLGLHIGWWGCWTSAGACTTEGVFPQETNIAAWPRGPMATLQAGHVTWRDSAWERATQLRGALELHTRSVCGALQRIVGMRRSSDSGASQNLPRIIQAHVCCTNG